MHLDRRQPTPHRKGPAWHRLDAEQPRMNGTVTARLASEHRVAHQSIVGRHHRGRAAPCATGRDPRLLGRQTHDHPAPRSATCASLGPRRRAPAEYVHPGRQPDPDHRGNQARMVPEPGDRSFGGSSRPAIRCGPGRSFGARQPRRVPQPGGIRGSGDHAHLAGHANRAARKMLSEPALRRIARDRPRQSPTRQHSALPIKVDSPRGGLPLARLRRVLEYVEAHLGEDTSLRQLAELARLSPDHFATLFRQSIGLPPHRYVLERRIARAKELLAGDQLSLAEIGYALGYTSQPHFITMFRKLTGLEESARLLASRIRVAKTVAGN